MDHLDKSTLDKKILIVVSDGADNASITTRQQLLAKAARSNAIIFGLGIYEADDPENADPRTVLKQLAKASGGEAFFPDTLAEIKPACEHIAHAIRTQYTLSYVPANQAQDGKYRAIQVRVPSHGGNWTVTTRAGYVAPANKNAAISRSPSN
jgi:VWFA-related protein